MQYLVIAISLMIIGHICKVLRWKQFVNIYEETENSNLLQALAIGQGINMIIPWRVGDFVRIYIAGRKMKNGHALSIATVFADLYIDTITVGLTFLVLYILGIHPQEIEEITLGYVTLASLLLVLTAIAIVAKIYVKKAIKTVAALFNEKIELWILYTTYSCLASVKSIVKGLNMLKILLQTACIWCAYFMSYGVFAIFLQKKDPEINATLTSVFKTVFSANGTALLGMYRGDIGVENTSFWIYMFLPIAIILISTIVYRKIRGEKITKYRYVLPQLNANEKLAFLEVYFKNEERREYINLYLAINRDVNVIHDYSAGSNATTMLCMNEKETFFRKYAFENDAEKLNEQVEWLEKYQRVLPLPKILNKNIGENYCCYDMEYNPYAVGFFQYIHSASAEESWKILREILDELRNGLHKSECRKADKDIIHKYIESKVVNNIEICRNGGKYLRALYDFDSIKINGVDYPNLKCYKDILSQENLERVFENDEYAIIHGDLTIENIICIQGKADNYYLIDPNTGSLHESPFLDYSKLLQSLHGGYEFLMSVKDVEISGNQINFLFTRSLAYSALYENYKEYLFNNYSKEQVKSIFYHEIIHYLRLMPYKIRKDAKKAVIFYAGMLMVLKDVKDMFD